MTEQFNSGESSFIFGINFHKTNIGRMIVGKHAWHQEEEQTGNISLALVFQEITVFFLPIDPRDKGHQYPAKIDFIVPRRAQYLHSAWMKHQDAVFWVDIDFAMKEGLTFYQTRSNAIIFPAYCIPKVARLNTGEDLHVKSYMSPRPQPKISLTHDHDWTKGNDELGTTVEQQPVGKVVRQSRGEVQHATFSQLVEYFRPKSISSTDTFIQTRFHPMTLSSNDTFIQNTFIQTQFHPMNIHPRTFSSNEFLIQWHFHPMTFSTNNGFIQKNLMWDNQYSPCLCESVAGRRPATPSRKHGLCPLFGFQQAFMWSIGTSSHMERLRPGRRGDRAQVLVRPNPWHAS